MCGRSAVKPLSGAELVDVARELALEVGCLVLRDSVLGSQLVEHLGEANESGLRLGLVGHGAQTAHGVTGSLCVVAVAQTARLGLTDSLQR